MRPILPVDVDIDIDQALERFMHERSWLQRVRCMLCAKQTARGTLQLLIHHRCQRTAGVRLATQALLRQLRDVA